MDNFSVDNINSADTITNPSGCRIRILGVGGGGCNTLQYMQDQKLEGADFILVNTDTKALLKSTVKNKIQIGPSITHGLGAGCDPIKGRMAADESRENIRRYLQGSDLVFITAGMGGGTGTGASPTVAQLAHEAGALTVAVVTKPFHFEGRRHLVNAEAGIQELAKHVDSIIVIDNNKLLKSLGNASLIQAFNACNDVLLNAVRGITDSINNFGIINLDFADVRTVLKDRGHAVIGMGHGKGQNMVRDAVEQAIHSPLMEKVNVASAAGIIGNIRISPNFLISNINEVFNAIQSYGNESADCKFGIRFDQNLEADEVAVTILIAGISAADPEQAAGQRGRPQQAGARPGADGQPFPQEGYSIPSQVPFDRLPR